eukprot:GDKI01031259.1.p1 GENE.GDKI01031259.1~~GDKI01031259.1.p1  ORF type:complete len:605 (-),score=173.62 GDKI01031259.1:223-1935(-)
MNCELSAIREDNRQLSLNLKSLTMPDGKLSPQTTDSPKHGDMPEAIDESLWFVNDELPADDDIIEQRCPQGVSDEQANLAGDDDFPAPEEVLDWNAQAAADFVSESETEYKPKQKTRTSEKKQQFEQHSEQGSEDDAEQQRRLRKNLFKLQQKGDGGRRRDESPSRQERSPSRRSNSSGRTQNNPRCKRSNRYLVGEKEGRRSTSLNRKKSTGMGAEKKTAMQQKQLQPAFQMAVNLKPPVRDEKQEPSLSCSQRLERFFFGWSRGYLRRWIVILWAVLIVYSCGLLARVLMNFTDFGTFCEDLALAQKTHFYFRNACTRVMDTVVWERMPWRTDGGQKLREDFDAALNLAELSFNTLISHKDASKYDPRHALLFQDTCLLDSDNCGQRVGWEAYETPELMERGLYRAALVWIEHVRELRREYAETTLPDTFINSTHPPEFWFVRDSIAYDLAPGLFMLIGTYIQEARDLLPASFALVWVVAGGGLAVVGFASIVCVMLMKWQWQQVTDALTALRLLSWEDVQNQTILTTARIVGDNDGPAGDGQDRDDIPAGQVGMPVVPMHVRVGIPV